MSSSPIKALALAVQDDMIKLKKEVAEIKITEQGLYSCAENL